MTLGTQGGWLGLEGGDPGKEMSSHNRDEEGLSNSGDVTAPPPTGPVGPAGPTGPSGPVGPRRQTSVVGQGVAPPPDIFADYSGPAIDASKTIIKQEMAYLGWPAGMDANQMALDLLKNNLENRPADAYTYLFNSKYLTDDIRKANPWAKFAMDPDTYRQNLQVMTDSIQQTTGMKIDLNAAGDNSSSQALLQNALKGNWSQKQIIDAFQQGGFTDQFTGKNVDLSAIAGAQPWLAQGLTYQAQAQQYTTIYGAAPVDTEHLASWFRFNRAAATLGPWYSQKVSEQEAGPKVLTEVR